MTAFRDRVEQWQAEAPVRAAQRDRQSRLERAWGKVAGLGALLAVAVVLAVVVAVLVLLVIAAAGAWRLFGAIVVVLAIGAVAAKVRARG